MDEIELFAALRPETPADLAARRERVSGRLSYASAVGAAGGASGASGAGARPAARRFGLTLTGAKVVAASGAALAVGGAVVLPSILAPGQSGSFVTAAWAVQPRKDGTVKLTIKDASDPAGLERALRVAGVRAVVVSPREISVKDSSGGWVTYPSCHYATTGRLFAPASVRRAVVTLPRPAKASGRASRVIAFIHPAAMPARSRLFIVDTFSALPNGIHLLSVTSPSVLRSHRIPRCVRTSPPSPAPAPSPAPLPSEHPVPVPSWSGSPVPRPSGSPVPVPSWSGSPVPQPSASPVPQPSASPVPVPVPSDSPVPAPSPSPVPSSRG